MDTGSSTRSLASRMYSERNFTANISFAVLFSINPIWFMYFCNVFLLYKNVKSSFYDYTFTNPSLI